MRDAIKQRKVIDVEYRGTRIEVIEVLEDPGPTPFLVYLRGQGSRKLVLRLERIQQVTEYIHRYHLNGVYAKGFDDAVLWSRTYPV